jgi:hypothetical protein
MENFKKSGTETTVTLLRYITDESHAWSRIAERLHFKNMHPVKNVKR